MQILSNSLSKMLGKMLNIDLLLLIQAINTYLESKILDQVRKSHFFSIMADESCDVSTIEELSICARWLNNGKPVEHFLKLIDISRTDAQTIASAIKAFLDQNNLLATKN